ncbi:MAG: phosphate ABC transporter permease PstA [Dehalococcoidia bacterium]|nr:phosphate ABC transporter permease PstA [Dehalococcoidia bacterium]
MTSLTRRKATNWIMLSLCVVSALLAIAALVAILGYTIAKGMPALSIGFLTSMPQPVGEPGGGVFNAIVGTSVLVGLACLFGIPLGLLAGIYVAEFARPNLATAVRFIADVLFGIPSIVTGMFVYGLLVVRMGGYSALSGGIALALIMIPIIARTAEESLKLVPATLREAGLALGIQRWRTIVSIILPGALPGVVTGIMLGVARVAGETAPLIFTSFGNRLGYQGLGQPIASLPLQIYRYAISPYKDWQQQAWGAALLLIIMVLLVSVIVRVITARRSGRS